MPKYNMDYCDFVKCHECICRPSPCCCVGPPGPKGDPGPPGPFLSSYVEAVANIQDVENRSNIVFDTGIDTLDVVGGDIEVDSTGTVFIIKRAGLYHVEWSVNLESGEQPVLIGLLENGEPSSALSNYSPSGNYSSGALISVAGDEVPYTVSLHNFGLGIKLHNPARIENTAASMRILRFADGPSS